MKLNRSMLLATVTVLVVGSVAAVGYARSNDGDDASSVETEQATTEQTGATSEDAADAMSTNPGTEEYRGGSHGGASHGGSHGGSSHGGSSHGGSSHGGFHGGHGSGHGGYGHGYGRGGHGGYGHGYGRRWGRWGGGRWLDGRWVNGPYYGWCDDRYDVCNGYGY